MHPTRIAELLQPFLSPIPNPCHSELGQRPGEEPAALSPSQLNHISTYIDILLHWNSRINLTAIRNEEEIVTPPFAASLFAARPLFPTCSPVPSPSLVCRTRSPPRRPPRPPPLSLPTGNSPSHLTPPLMPGRDRYSQV